MKAMLPIFSFVACPFAVMVNCALSAGSDGGKVETEKYPGLATRKSFVTLEEGLKNVGVGLLLPE